MTDEVQEAKQAAASSSSEKTGAPTVFDKILSGEWSSDKVFEDEQCLAFRDVHPQAPVHIVLIPKQRGNLTKLSCASQEDAPLLGHLLYVAQLVGKEHCPRGFRIVINDGEHGSQSVYHLHLHILGGRQMTVRWLFWGGPLFVSIVCTVLGLTLLLIIKNKVAAGIGTSEASKYHL
jgi:histidine triad (HIT) family protein